MDDLDLERPVGLGTDGDEIDVLDIGDLVGLEGLGRLEDLVGNTLWGGSAIGKVVLDTEIFIWA